MTRTELRDKDQAVEGLLEFLKGTSNEEVFFAIARKEGTDAFFHNGAPSIEFSKSLASIMLTQPYIAEIIFNACYLYKTKAQ